MAHSAPAWAIEEMLELGTLLAENEQKHGYKDWYDWHNSNWGSCQNAWFDANYDTKGDTFLSFTTAWVAPMPVMKKLSAIFPEYEFKFSWWNSSDSFGEKMVVQGGEVVECEPI